MHHPVTERHVQAIWYDRTLRPRNLATRRGMTVAMCGERLIGRGRAAAILANVILPFALAEGRVNGVPAWLPPEDVSAPMRLTAFRLFGRDHNPPAFYAGNGLHLQGLLQIYRDHCLQHHPDCHDCRLADRSRTPVQAG